MADFIDADLRGSRFERADLSGALLRAVDLSGARFRSVDLSGVVMHGAELAGVDIHGEIAGLTINGVDIGPLVGAPCRAAGEPPRTPPPDSTVGQSPAPVHRPCLSAHSALLQHRRDTR